MANIDKIIKSKNLPKQTNVAWIDLSGETPVEKHFINGRWVSVSGGGEGSKIVINPDEEATETLNKIKVGNTVYNADISGKADKITVAYSIPNSGMLPNVLYLLRTISTNTTFLLATATDNTIANIWHWTFSTGSTAPTITWPAEITMWNGGEIPEIEANKYYEVSVMNGVGIVISADIPQTEVEP